MSSSTLEKQTEAVLARLHDGRLRDWADRCAHHPPRTRAVVQAHETSREIVAFAGRKLVELLPPCPEVDRCLDALHLALMHANTAIALHHPENTEPGEPT